MESPQADGNLLEGFVWIAGFLFICSQYVKKDKTFIKRYTNADRIAKNALHGLAFVL